MVIRVLYCFRVHRRNTSTQSWVAAGFAMSSTNTADARERWAQELRESQTVLMTFGYSVIDVLPDVVQSVLSGLTDAHVYELAQKIYENTHGRKDALTHTSLFFPMGKDVVVASYLEHFDKTASAADDGELEAANMNACKYATNLLEFLEKQKRLDVSGPFGTRDEHCAGDIQPGMQGLRQMVIAWSFGFSAPLESRVVDEARPHIRNNDEVSCNKLLSKLTSTAHASTSFALSLEGPCGLSKSFFTKRFKAAHEQTPANLYRALLCANVLGPGFFEAESETGDLLHTVRTQTRGVSPLLHYVRILERKILGDC